MARLEIIFKPRHYFPAVHPRQSQIQQDRIRMILIGQLHPGFAIFGNQALKSIRMRVFEQEFHRSRIIFNNQERQRIGGQAMAIIANIADFR